MTAPFAGGFPALPEGDIGPPLTRTFFVDKESSNSVENGSISQPFKTIQAALDFIGEPVDAVDQETTFTIQIVSGTYNENLIVPQNRQIELRRFSGSVVVNSITWNQDSTLNPGSAIPILIIGVSTVLGNLNFSDIGVGAPITAFVLIGRDLGTDILGDIIFTGFTFTLGILILRGGQVQNIVSPLGGPGGIILLEAVDTNFVGTVEIFGFARVLDSNMEAKWTVDFTGFFGTGANGFIGCFFVGADFEGPVGSFIVDTISNFWAKTNGVTLIAPATKVIQADITP